MSKIIRKVCKAITIHLGAKYITLPGPCGFRPFDFDSKLKIENQILRVHNRFSGKRDLAIFRGDIRDMS